MIKLERYLEGFQNIVIIAITLMMSLVVLMTMIELGYIVTTYLIELPLFLLNFDDMLAIFGYFMLVLIGIELLETLKTYAEKHPIKVQVVFLIAMMAIARKIIILNESETSGVTLVGIGIVIIALSIGYFLLRWSHIDDNVQNTNCKT